MRDAVPRYSVIDVIGGRALTVDNRPDRVLLDLADRIRRLAPSSTKPHRFHEDKSEIVYELERLAGEVRRG